MDAATLVKAFARIGYVVTRQTGSHIRLTTSYPQQHHVTIPNHSPIKVGTLNSILTAVATQLRISRDELLQRLLP